MTKRRLYRVRVTDTVFFVSEPGQEQVDARAALREAASNVDARDGIEVAEMFRGTPRKEIPKGWLRAIPFFSKARDAEKYVEDWLTWPAPTPPSGDDS